MLYCRIGNKDKNNCHATLHINTFSDLDYQLSDVKHINISIYKKKLRAKQFRAFFICHHRLLLLIKIPIFF